MMRKILWLFILPLFTQAQTKAITLEDIYQKNTFRAENVPGFRTMHDGRYYTQSSSLGIVKMNFVTGQKEAVLVAADDVKDEQGNKLPLNDVEWSEEENKLLIFLEREKIYRHSSKALVYAYNVATKQAIKIDTGKILHATFSPNGSKVAFVKNNNLFYKDLANGLTTQVTSDGAWNRIINGNCDWVYEEEFSFSRAFQWSPAGSFLAYYKFNETKVPEYTLALYNNLYPTQYTYKYPKAGEANSVIEIHIYQLANGNDVKVDMGAEKDVYIPRIKWSAANNKLGVAWLNRLQNHLQWFLAEAGTGATSLLYDESNKYYVSINDDLTFLPNGSNFITTSQRGGNNHIYLYNLNGTLQTQLTKGGFDVEDIAGIDTKNKLVYYTAAVQSPLDRQLFVTPYGDKQAPTRQISQGAGVHKINMNNDFTYYVDSYSNLNSPATISIFGTDGKAVRLLKDNAALKEKMLAYGWSNAAFIKVPNTKGDTLNGWMLKPKNFDSTKKYPVLFCNYGGPGSQYVTDAWGKVNFWQQMLAEQGYIIVSIDNTGTGFRGEEFEKKTYLQLGKFEIEDQIDAARYLGNLSYIDKNRIGHWGWSFGGFMSCLAITKGAGVFKTAVAVAPVTDWQFYDNIYTERYMRTPRQNAKGYFDNAPLNFTQNIKGNLLIIHGTADDNVHFQNSVMMVNKMTENNIPFSSAYYPNKNHNISGGNTQLHIYTKMTDYILKNL